MAAKKLTLDIHLAGLDTNYIVFKRYGVVPAVHLKPTIR